MKAILKDARYALKLLAKQRGFTAAALLTLALCIGANTAMFSVVRSVLLKPLPFRDADRITLMYNSYPGAGVERGSSGVPDYYDRIEHTSVFSDIAMLQTRGMTIGESGRPERITGMGVTPSFFTLLRTDALVGRTFSTEEGEPGDNRVAIIAYGMWQDRYAGASDVIGNTIRINEVAHTIVGVMPRGFSFEMGGGFGGVGRRTAVQIWVPLVFTAEMRGDDNRHSNSWEMIARLKPDATLAQAQQQIDALNAMNEERFPEYAELLRQAGFRTHVVDYQEYLTADVRSTLWLLQAGALFVLLIGCVNIANLMLVRATSRQRELATRAALGAGHARLVRQLLTESLVLALVGGGLGVLVGRGTVRAFAVLTAHELPRAAEIAVDPTVMLVSLGAALLAGLLFGAIPVARLMRQDLSAVFRDEGRTGTASRGTHIWRGTLVVTQVALAFALLIGAGLLITSFARTLAIDPGFEPKQLLTASVSLPGSRYGEADQQRQFTARLLERVRRVPGIEQAAVTNVLLFGDDFNATAVTPEGYTPEPDESVIAPVNSRISDDYFETMGIDIVAGRSFTIGDVQGAPPVAIIDQTLADRFWPGHDPLGKRIAQGVPGFDDELVYRTVVGVVRSVRVSSLTGDQPPGHYYVPIAQDPSTGMFLAMRTNVDPVSVTNAVRAAVTELDADLPLYRVFTMRERIAASLTTERARMSLLAVFATLALLLAAVGLYGVLAYSVAQRTGEIGIRMALGSSARDVFRMVVGQGGRLVLIGLAAGIAGSLILTRVVRGMLYDVTPTDPLVYAGVVAVLSLTAIVACAVPARRAMRVDPLVAIRETV